MAKISLQIQDDSTRSALTPLLSAAGHEVMTGAMDGAEVILTEQSQPLREMLSQHLGVPVIVVAGSADISSAIEAMKLGAADFVLQPVRGDELIVRINRAIEHATVAREIASLRGRAPTDQLAGQPLAEVEKKIIISTLQQFRGHRVKTASALGIGVRTLGMKLKRWKEEGQLVEA